MTRLVQEAVVEFGDLVKVKKIVTKTLEGAMRYREIIKHTKKLVPIPSIIINENLVFKTIPGKQELINFLDATIYEQI